jgi:hypothetical protein
MAKETEGYKHEGGLPDTVHVNIISSNTAWLERGGGSMLLEETA